MARIEARYLNALLGFVLISSNPTLQAPRTNRLQERRSPAQILNGIKAIVEDPSLVKVFPSFTLDLQNKKINFYIFVETQDAQTLPEDDPYRLLFEALLRGYADRVALERSGVDEKLWRPQLKEMENSVYSAIVEIEGNPNRSDLKQFVLDRWRETRANDAFYAVIHHYERLGFTPQGVGAESYEMFGVSVITDPPNGTVRVLPLLFYKKQLLLKTPRNGWPWRTLTQQTEALAGRYHYFVSWPDGRTAEGDLEVRNNSNLRFIPN